jgi:hypothetical protein
MSIPTIVPGALERPDTDCACGKCMGMCSRPCWPTPEEANKLIDNGYADKLMLDWWTDGDGDIFIICPANPGYGGQRASDYCFGVSDLHSGCMMNENGCTLKPKSLQPLEGRKAYHDHEGGLHQSVAALWNSDAGRKVVKRYRDLVKI